MKPQANSHTIPGLSLAHIFSPPGRQAEGATPARLFHTRLLTSGQTLSLLAAGNGDGAMGAMGFITHPLSGLRPVSCVALTI